MVDLEELYLELERVLVEDPPIHLKEGGTYKGWCRPST
jgi:hypothetical protein